MAKNTTTTLGLLALAALLFRTPGFVSTEHEPSGKPPVSVPGKAGKKVAGEGPWNASCEYWAAARPAEEGEAEAGNETAGSEEIAALVKSLREEGKSKCGDDKLGRWGLPGSEIKPDINALIAIVPDPRTNMSLLFDRTIDALMGAAGDNDYVSTYYWLPWKQQSPATEMESGGAESLHEPGLIIFKNVPSPRKGTAVSSPDNSKGVIYLFVVGETPTTGIDGFQIQKVFRYEDELAGVTGINFRRSTGDQPDVLSIIGPTFTGSAASLRQAIDTTLLKHSDPKSALYIGSVYVSGTSATEFAAKQLTHEAASQPIWYRSFAYDAAFDQQRLLDMFCHSSSRFSPIRVALLIEDGTAFGSRTASSMNAANGSSTASSMNAAKANESPASCYETDPTRMLQIRFPREISLLRNAQAESTQAGKGGESSEGDGSPPSPYLRLSLKDSNAYDSVPHLSRENTPASQEAQLMAIARQLLRYRSQYIVISGSNILDLIFLAQFLHRACPDARLVFYVGDLLFEREVDNVPFIGSLTLTPYPLIGSGATAESTSRRAYSDSNSQAYFNAASFTFWNDPLKFGKLSDANTLPRLSGYRNMLLAGQKMQNPPLWVTAIGSDGYYPLGIASGNAQGEDDPHILPRMPALKPNEDPASQGSTRKFPVAPGRAWNFLCVLVIGLCVFHAVSVWSADFWSPFTRELAVDQGDQPRRRAMYVNIATVMLFCMALVLAIPAFSMFRIAEADFSSRFLSGAVTAAGILTALVTLGRIRRYLGWERASNRPKVAGLLHQQHLYFFFNVIAWATMVWVPLLWLYLCYCHAGDWLSRNTDRAGIFFSFRCVQAWSGVSPLIPVLLLLFSWYLWAFFSTWRLRFSDNNRPMLPGRLYLGTPYPFFVADDDLRACDSARDACLYKNLSCLLITREVVWRFVKPSRFGVRGEQWFDGVLIALYVLTFAIFVVFIPVRSLDTFLWATGGLPTPYESLVTVLFFPLLFIAVSAWLRVILVWGALRRGLLERLENLPIRYAFNRLKGSGWMAMLRQGGLHEHWRDMARSIESMRQMVNDPKLEQFMEKNASTSTATAKGAYRGPGKKIDGSPAASRWLCWGLLNASLGDAPEPTQPVNPLKTINGRLNLFIKALLAHGGGVEPAQGLLQAARCLSNQADLPAKDSDIGLVLMRAVEENYAEFSEALLERVLVPYWMAKRSSPVENEEIETKPEHEHSEESGKESKQIGDPIYIRVAEEFLAIRYLSLIRVVLGYMRALLLFVSASFVLAIVAWNSYPFQPRQFIDLVFTCMLAVLGCGIIIVLVQMHRDPILSRITHTKPNELGVEFYVRIVALGAVPVLTWVAYQFPDLGKTLFKVLQPGLEVVK